MVVDDLQFHILKKKIRKEPLDIRIISGSMEPLIKIDEQVKVEYCESPKVFDVIIYHSADNKLICHFVWGESKAQPGFLLLQSLTSAPLDLPVAQEKILGRVKGKKISLFYKMIFVLKRLFV